MKVTSSAALCSLTVSESEKANDLALQWILSLASSKQVTVSMDKKAKLSLTLCDDSVKLVQRPAILRALSGMALHNALDQAPHYVLGGHSTAVGASPFHAMSLASITSWMSVAKHIADDDKGDVDMNLLATLESHLATRSFLVPSSQCTLADIDVSMAMLKRSKNAATYIDQIVSGSYPNVHRWALACRDTVMCVGTIVGVPALDVLPQSPPMFFYGTEDPLTVPTPAVAKKPAPAVAATGKKGGGGDSKKAEGKKKGEAKQGKAAKKGGQQQQQAPATFDVTALDIRVGKIVKAWHHPESDKLFCEEVDLGEEGGPRKIASGLRPFYKTEDLENRRVVVLCNLKARSLAGFPSHGMVLCASNADHTQVQFMAAPDDAAIGERVVFEGYTDGAPEPENKVAKKKIFEGLAPDLKTNADGICEWKGNVSKMEKAGGPIKACNGMPNAQVS